MTSNGESTQPSPPSTFPHFSHLPIELRTQIWQHAFTSATNPVIPVTINHHPVQTTHSCVPLLKSFCGQHSHCPIHNSNPNPNPAQPTSSLISMFNGYFSLPPTTPDDTSDSSSSPSSSAVHNLTLACTESHRTFLSQYPETLTIYKTPWYPSAPPPPHRRLRCNPATSTLLVKSAPSYPSRQRHPSPSSLEQPHPEDIYHEDIKKWFPRDPDVFAGFRRIVAGFRRVVFSFLDVDDAEEEDDDLQTGLNPPVRFSRVFEDMQFKQFLIFFERLEYLYLCSDAEEDPLTAGRKWERVVEHNHDAKARRCDGSMDNMDLQNFVGMSSGILNCDYDYQEYVRVRESERSADGDSAECGCWVPTPKGFEGSWLFYSERCR